MWSIRSTTVCLVVIRPLFPWRENCSLQGYFLEVKLGGIRRWRRWLLFFFIFRTSACKGRVWDVGILRSSSFHSLECGCSVANFRQVRGATGELGRDGSCSSNQHLGLSLRNPVPSYKTRQDPVLICQWFLILSLRGQSFLHRLHRDVDPACFMGQKRLVSSCSPFPALASNSLSCPQSLASAMGV